MSAAISRGFREGRAEVKGVSLGEGDGDDDDDDEDGSDRIWKDVRDESGRMW